MPFTPFHFGPGALIKAGLRKYFSFSIFVFTQVIIDLETLYFILKEDFPLHRTLHTYLGSNIAVLIAVIVGRPVCRTAIKIWNRVTNNLFKLNAEITVASAFITAIIGAYSHVFLDSIMHTDMRPFYPFSNSNPLFRIIGLRLLHQLCVLSGLIGIGILTVAYRRKEVE